MHHFFTLEHISDASVPGTGLGPGNGSNEVLSPCPLARSHACSSISFFTPSAHPCLQPVLTLTLLSAQEDAPQSSLPPPLPLLCDHSVVQELTLSSECVRLYAILRPQHFVKTWWRTLPNPRGWGLSNLSLGPAGCLGARLSEPATELAGTYAVSC